MYESKASKKKKFIQTVSSYICWDTSYNVIELKMLYSHKQVFIYEKEKKKSRVIIIMHICIHIGT